MTLNEFAMMLISGSTVAFILFRILVAAGEAANLSEMIED